MYCLRVFEMMVLINWLVTINLAAKTFIEFVETRPGQIPNGGVTQIATVPTPSAFGCARLCWDNLNKTGCRGIIYQPDSCNGDKVKPSSPGSCQMVDFSETKPLTFGTATQPICQKFYSLPIANCSIVARSYSLTYASCSGSTLYDQFGYVSLNGNMVFNMSACPVLQAQGGLRGVMLMTIDPLSCTSLGIKQYDTFGSTGWAVALATAIKTAANGTVFVGVTVDEPQQCISPANSTLLSYCNVDLTNLQYRGNFAFVCVIGRPFITKWQLKPYIQGPGSMVAATVSGTPVGGSLVIV